MRNEAPPAKGRRRYRMQVLAFLLVFLPPFGLYAGVSEGMSWLVWLLLGLTAAGMVMGMWVC